MCLCDQTHRAVSVATKSLALCCLYLYDVQQAAIGAIVRSTSTERKMPRQGD